MIMKESDLAKCELVEAVVEGNRLPPANCNKLTELDHVKDKCKESLNSPLKIRISDFYYRRMLVTSFSIAV